MDEQVRIQFFKHQVNTRQDEKIIQLLRKEGWSGYGLFWAILEFLGPIKDHKSKCDYQDLAWDLRADAEQIKHVIENYGLFKTKNGFFYSESFCKQLDETNDLIQRRRESASRAGRRSGEVRREKNNRSNDRSTTVQTDVTEKANHIDTKDTIDTIDTKESKDIFPSNEAKNLSSSSSVEVCEHSTSKSKEEEEEEKKLLEEKINKGEIQLFRKIEDVPPEIRKSFEEFWQLFRPDQSQYTKYKVSLMQWKDMDPRYREAVLRWLHTGYMPENRNPYYFHQHVRPQFLNKREQLQLHKAGKKLVSVRLDGKQWVCTAYVADLFQLEVLDPEYNKKFE